MTLQEYISLGVSKYAVISTAAFEADPVAQALSSSPRQFTVAGVSYVILSLDPSSVSSLASYVESTGVGIEFEFIKDSGNVSLLTHAQALALLQEYGNESV